MSQAQQGLPRVRHWRQTARVGGPTTPTHCLSLSLNLLDLCTVGGGDASTLRGPCGSPLEDWVLSPPCPWAILPLFCFRAASSAWWRVPWWPSLCLAHELVNCFTATDGQLCEGMIWLCSLAPVALASVAASHTTTTRWLGALSHLRAFAALPLMRPC